MQSASTTRTAAAAHTLSHNDGGDGATVALPMWQRDLQQQIVARNAVELTPLQTIVIRYAQLQRRLRRLRGVAEAKARLAANCSRLDARVRALEAAAASAQLHTTRERDLEQRCSELQERLRTHLERETTYYKGMAEVSEWRAKMSDLAARVQYAEDAVAQRNAELTLLKKEYVSLRDENATLRHRLAEAEHAAAGATAALTTRATALQQRVHTLEQQLQQQQQQQREGAVAAPPAGDSKKDSSSSNSNMNATVPHMTLDTATMRSAIGHTTTAATTPMSIVTATHGGSDGGSSAMRSTASMTYPRAAARIMYDAHGGSPLQAMCLVEGGVVRSAGQYDGSSGSHAAMTLVSAGNDKTLRLWDVQHATELRRVASNSLVLALHSSASVLAAGCADRAVRLWDVRTLRAQEMTGHDEKVVTVCVSASGQHVFSGSSDGTLRMWDVRQHTALRTMLCLSTSNDVTVAGDTIFSAHYNGTVCVWDRRSAARALEVRAHARVATCVRITHDGRLCVSLGRDDALSVRDVRAMTRELLRVTPSALTVPSNWARFALAVDSRVAAVGTAHGDVLLLALTTPSPSVHVDPRAAMAKSSSSSSDGGGGATSVVRGDDAVVQDLSLGGHEPDRPIYSVVWGSDATSPLISLGDDRRLVVWQ